MGGFVRGSGVRWRKGRGVMGGSWVHGSDLRVGRGGARGGWLGKGRERDAAGLFGESWARGGFGEGSAACVGGGVVGGERGVLGENGVYGGGVTGRGENRLRLSPRRGSVC